MSVANQALHEGNLGRAHRLLESQRPRTGNPDLRGFEWRYLWKQAQGDKREKLGDFQGFIGALAVSPDSQLIALNQENPTRIDIVRLLTKTVVRSLPSSQTVGPLRFSPDGAFLVGQAKDQVVGWNTKTFQTIEPLPVTFPLAFLPDSKSFLAQDGDHFSLWSAEAWKKVKEFPAAKTLPAVEGWASQQALAVSADGQQFYYLSDRWRIQGWDLKEQKALAPIELDRGALVTCLAFSPDRLLGIACWDGTVRILDLKTREWLAQFNEHLSWISGLAFLQDGSRLVSASADQTIVLYNPRARTVSGRLRGHDSEIWALAVAPDGKSLITGAGYGGAVLHWPLQDNKSVPEPAFVVRTLADGRLLRYLPDASDYERYDLGSGKVEPAGMERLGDLVRRPIYPSDFNSAAPGWVVVSPDTRWTVSNSGEKLAVNVWNSNSGEREQVLSNHFGQVMHASFSGDGAFLALFGKDSEVSLFRTADWTGRTVTAPLNGRAQVVFAPDSRRLVVVAAPAGVLVLDVASTNVVARFEGSNLSWTSAAFSKDADYFALGGQDNLIRVYDLKNRKALTPLAGHAAGVWGLAFSPDKKTLASAGDKRIKLWSVDTWQEFFTLHTGERNPHGLNFSADGRFLVSYAPFQVWEAPTLAEIDALGSMAQR